MKTTILLASLTALLMWAGQALGGAAGLASALRKIEAWSRELPMQEGTPATAHLFIHNPSRMEGQASLFSTHPPTEHSVARLEAIGSGRLPVAA